jgi:cytochrome c-type biogenesis protein CcmH
LRLIRSRTVLGDRDQAVAAVARARTALASDPQGLAQVEQGARDLGLGAGESAGPPATSGPVAQADTGAAMAAMRAMPPAERDAAIRGMVEGLDRRLAARGGTPDDWLRLVRSYSVIGERDQATKALNRARMALAANSEAVARLDGLARELDLPAKPSP